jgi:hypothetical protein
MFEIRSHGHGAPTAYARIGDKPILQRRVDEFWDAEKR